MTNAAKAVLELTSDLHARGLTCRCFVFLLSLEMYALHTTRMNPAVFFHLRRACRGVCSLFDKGQPWDSELRFVDLRVNKAMRDLSAKLVENPWWTIAPEVHAQYNDEQYDCISYTDASAEGWGAISRWKDGTGFKQQQRWGNELADHEEQDEEQHRNDPFHFTAKHSAHVELAAVLRLLQLQYRRDLTGDQRRAEMTDHIAFVRVQRRQNGYGGLVRGCALNALLQHTNGFFYERNVHVVFFHGRRDQPAGGLSHHFREDKPRTITGFPTDDCEFPLLGDACSPFCQSRE